MAEPGPPRRRALEVREIVNALDEPMRRRGFHRSDPFLAEATALDHWVASWLREPPPSSDREALTPDGTPLRVGFYDGVSVWSEGYVKVGMQGNAMYARLEWRQSQLDADEFACVVTGVVDQVDRFVPHTGPTLRGTGFTRS